jgi:hypothetical protein
MRRLILVAQLACSGLAFDVFKLDIPEDSWQSMAQCPPKGALRTEAIKAEFCGYKGASCSFGGSEWASCKVKRKGSASWRAMGLKPSFKIKSFELSGAPVNYSDTWSAKRVTLNNMVQGTTGPKAYEAFRQASVIAPESRYVTVMLYRIGVHVRSDTYNLLETISDDDFMDKHFPAANYALWEVEGGEHELKKDKGFGGSIDYAPNMSNVGPSLARYLAVAVSINHWDGAPFVDHNYYVAWANDTYTIIPSGVDQTYSCRNSESTPASICVFIPDKYLSYYNCPTETKWEVQLARTCMTTQWCSDAYDASYDDSVVDACNEWPNWAFVALWMGVALVGMLLCVGLYYAVNCFRASRSVDSSI